jgi:hypothetical protein
MAFWYEDLDGDLIDLEKFAGINLSGRSIKGWSFTEEDSYPIVTCDTREEAEKIFEKIKKLLKTYRE